MTNQEAGAALPIDSMRDKIARAICSAMYGPLEEGSWAVLGEHGKESLRRSADAILALIEPVMEENERLLEALEWASDADPQLVEQIKGRAALSPKSEIAP
jgi:hypothetical protein